MQRVIHHVILFVCIIVFGSAVVRAEQFTSTNFTILDPVLVPSGFGTSTGFQLWGSLSEIAIGTSTVADFSVNSGFLFYPYVTVPTVTAVANNASASLSWTASEGFLGWTATSYSIGQSTNSGGPYTYTSLGNVFSSTRTGLVNNTPYYFVVIVKDVFGNFIGTSTEVAVTPTNGGPVNTGDNGGRGSIFGDVFGLTGKCTVDGADLNGDGKVNLIDLSILLYYLNRSNGPSFDCNGDNKIDFIDISILFYYWTD